MTKFFQICNGRNIPKCPRGCEGMEGSMSPHVLKWHLLLSWETFVVGRNPAHRQHFTPEAAWQGGSLCLWMEWGTTGSLPTYLPLFLCSFLWLSPGLSLTASFVPFLLSHLPSGLCVWNKLSLAVCQSSRLLCRTALNALSLKTLSCIIPLRSGMREKKEVQSKLQIRRQCK